MKTYSKFKKTAATATLATLVTISSLSVSAQTDEKNDLDLVIDKAVSVMHCQFQ